MTAEKLLRMTAESILSYREPFLGGGALLFHIQPQNAVLNAVNVELLNLYTVIRDKVEYLIEDLKNHVNEKDYFYHIRSFDRNGKIHELSDVERASRMIYLNKTCFNGFFKVNEQGQFDAPFGSYKNPFNPSKTVEGTIIGMVVATLAAWFFIDFKPAFLASVIAMVIESFAFKWWILDFDDNVLVPVVAGSIMSIIV